MTRLDEVLTATATVVRTRQLRKCMRPQIIMNGSGDCVVFRRGKFSAHQGESGFRPLLAAAVQWVILFLLSSERGQQRGQTIPASNLDNDSADIGAGRWFQRAPKLYLARWVAF